MTMQVACVPARVLIYLSVHLSIHLRGMGCVHVCMSARVFARSSHARTHACIHECHTSISAHEHAHAHQRTRARARTHAYAHTKQRPHAHAEQNGRLTDSAMRRAGRCHTHLCLVARKENRRIYWAGHQAPDLHRPQPKISEPRPTTAARNALICTHAQRPATCAAPRFRVNETRCRRDRTALEQRKS